MRYALINESGIVENVIMWDGKSELDTQLHPVPSDEANIGWRYVDSEFISPEQPETQAS